MVTHVVNMMCTLGLFIFYILIEISSVFPETHSKLCHFTTVVAVRFTTNAVNSVPNILNITIK
jgi:hypothetical protein